MIAEHCPSVFSSDQVSSGLYPTFPGLGELRGPFHQQFQGTLMGTVECGEMAFGSCKDKRKASSGLPQKISLTDMFQKPLRAHLMPCKLDHEVSGGFLLPAT